MSSRGTVVWCVGRWTYRGIVVVWLLLLSLGWSHHGGYWLQLRVVVFRYCEAGRFSALVVLSVDVSRSREAGRVDQRLSC